MEEPEMGLVGPKYHFEFLEQHGRKKKGSCSRIFITLCGQDLPRPFSGLTKCRRPMTPKMSGVSQTFSLTNYATSQNTEIVTPDHGIS